METRSAGMLRSTDRIYVAGHKGLVGSAIWRALTTAGYANLIGKTSGELDLRDAEAVDRFIGVERPDVIVLAAARVGGILANATRPADFLADNLRIQLNVMEAARHRQVPRLLFLGSSCIYPKFSPQPIQESALLTGPLEPTNDAYAIAKICGVLQVQALRRQDGLRYISAMPTNLYGPGDNFDLEDAHVLPALLRRFHEAKAAKIDEVVVWGTGQVRREFMHVDDLASACVHLLESYDDPEPINVGTGLDVTIAELADLVARTVGFEGQVTYDTTRPDGTPRKLLDVSKLRSTGFAAEISLESGIRSTYAWYREAHGDGERAEPSSANRAARGPRMVRVGAHKLTAGAAWDGLQAYARDQAVVVHNFDCARSNEAVAETGITLSTFARLMFLDRSLTSLDAIAALQLAEEADWVSIPPEATLAEADPEERDGLYDAAEAMHRFFLQGVPRLGAATVSAILHLQRPHLFPLLDMPIRRLYEERAIHAWELSERSIRPRSGRTYWPVFRDDLLAGLELIHEWRGRLGSSNDIRAQRLATVSDVRLWDSMARAVAAASGLSLGIGGARKG